MGYLKARPVLKIRQFRTILEMQLGVHSGWKYSPTHSPQSLPPKDRVAGSESVGSGRSILLAIFRQAPKLSGSVSFQCPDKAIDGVVIEVFVT